MFLFYYVIVDSFLIGMTKNQHRKFPLVSQYLGLLFCCRLQLKVMWEATHTQLAEKTFIFNTKSRSQLLMTMGQDLHLQKVSLYIPLRTVSRGILFERGSYMSAHIVFNCLNKLMEYNARLAEPFFFTFCNEFKSFNNTGVLMLISFHQMALKYFQITFFGEKVPRICYYIVDFVIVVIK